MVRQDIVSALRNALERGYSLQQAKISLINAGYAVSEVDVAANYLASGIGINTEQVSQVSQPQQSFQSQQFQQVQQPKPQQYQQLPNIQSNQSSEKSSVLGIVLLLISLFILLVLLGVSLFFKDAIIDFLKKFFV